MNYIDILPQIRNNIFYVRIVMTDYDVENQMVIRIVARRNDGLYKTEVVQYPNEGTDYGGEIIVPMFGMAKSLVAQIVGVKINGTEVRVNSTEVEVISTNNPKTLRIADQSEWGILADRPAIIEIVPPEDENKYVYYLGKNQLNVFNSKTLGINPGRGNDFENLKDGIYDITIKGSPSSYSFNRKYLKTDLIRLNIDKVWARSTVLCDHEDDDIINKIKEIEFLLAAAEANMRLGNFENVKQLYEKASKLIYVLNNCENCGCKM